MEACELPSQRHPQFFPFHTSVLHKLRGLRPPGCPVYRNFNDVPLHEPVELADRIEMRKTDWQCFGKTRLVP